MREAEFRRKTSETDVYAYVNLDDPGAREIDTGAGFLDHMLNLFAAHGRFGLRVKCAGDLRVDAHHTTEDTGIALGAAFLRASGDGRGIRRYSDIILPMDEALVMCAVDFGARAHLEYDLGALTEKVGEFDTELAREFFRAFAYNARATIHIKRLNGLNTHHILEAAFKAAGRALGEAVSIDPRARDSINSTKGVLS